MLENKKKNIKVTCFYAHKLVSYFSCAFSNQNGLRFHFHRLHSNMLVRGRLGGVRLGLKNKLNGNLHMSESLKCTLEACKLIIYTPKDMHGPGRVFASAL